MPSKAEMVKTTYLCSSCRKDNRRKFEAGFKPHQRMTAPCPSCRKLTVQKLVKVDGLRLTTWPGRVR